MVRHFILGWMRLCRGGLIVTEDELLIVKGPRSWAVMALGCIVLPPFIVIALRGLLVYQELSLFSRGAVLLFVLFALCPVLYTCVAELTFKRASRAVEWEAMEKLEADPASAEDVVSVMRREGHTCTIHPLAGGLRHVEFSSASGRIVVFLLGQMWPVVVEAGDEDDEKAEALVAFLTERLAADTDARSDQ